MKWNNRGHELEQKAEYFVQNFKAHGEKVYIFGAGLLGKEMMLILDKLGCFAGFIDNDMAKQQSGFAGKEVLSISDYSNCSMIGLVLIAANEKNIPSMKKQLLEIGLLFGKDFFIASGFRQEILPLIVYYHCNKVFIDLAQISLTERCTLKCEKCAHACYAVDAKVEDAQLEEVKSTVDLFLSKVDLIGEIALLGGEPLLYLNLKQVVTYIGDKHLDKVAILSITTNGTIIPSDELLTVCKQYNVLFRISNYVEAIPRLREKYTELIRKLKNWNINYVLAPESFTWMDYGFDYVDNGGNERKLLQVFDTCRTPCREIRDEKLYYCIMARSVSDNLNLQAGMNDYLDLTSIDESNRACLLEYQMGYSEKGYLDMCRYCHGSSAVDYPIPVAKQIERGKN